MNLSIKEKTLSVLVFLSAFINKGHVRSVRTKKNIIASCLIKGGNVLAGLILMPLTIHYVNPTQYGIWVTLVSIIGWFSFFDLGFGNGLRNKFAEAIAKNDHQQARIYLSTGYAILSGIGAILFILFCCISPFLDWSSILNAPVTMAGELSVIALLVFSFFCIQFVLQLLTTIMAADQRFAKASFLNFLSSLISLFVIFLLTKTTSGKLLYLALSISLAPVLVLAISSFLLYRKSYKKYAPSLKYVNLHYAKNIANLSLRFFIIQASGILIYSTDNVIIAHLYGPQEVIPYNAAFRYFSIANILFSIIIGPFWSATTEAYVKQDLDWIKRAIKKLFRTAIFLCVLLMLMLMLSPTFYAFWLGDNIKVPTLLSLFMAIYFMFSMLIQPFTFFINATGYIKIQLIQSVAVAVINIPLAVYFARGLQMGISGIILSTIVCFLPGLILAPLQYRKIINNNATGSWIE